MIRLAFLLCLLAVPAVAQPVIWQGTQFDNNQLIEKSARSGNAPTITVGGQGSDTNLSISIVPKGTGTVNITNPAFSGSIGGDLSGANVTTAVGARTNALSTWTANLLSQYPALVTADEKFNSDGVISASSTAFNSPSASFTQADVGKAFIGLGLGVGGADLVTTIAGVTDSTHITLGAAATNAAPWYTVGNAWYSSGSTITASYVPGDTLTVSGGTATTAGQFTVVNTQVASATVNAGGSGGTTGACTVKGTTGTTVVNNDTSGGLNTLATNGYFTATGTVSGGALTGALTITYSGAYSVNPTSLSAEPVTGCGLTGATLTLKMAPNSMTQAVAGQYSALPSNPVSTTGGTGSGAQLTLYATSVFNNTFSGQVQVGGLYAYGTDNTTAINNAISSAMSTSVGGVVKFPCGAVLMTGAFVLPITGTAPPQQNAVRLTGCGQIGTQGHSGGWQSYWLSPTNGTLLDNHFSGDAGAHLAKLQTLGNGKLQVDHLTLADYGTDNFLFFLDTNSIVTMNDVSFIGNPTCFHQTCSQSAIRLGGITSAGNTLGTNNPLDGFQGYGTAIKDVSYDHIAEFVQFGGAANALTIVNNMGSYYNGSSGSPSCAYHFYGVASGVGNTGDSIIGGVIEMGGYQYGACQTTLSGGVNQSNYFSMGTYDESVGNPTIGPLYSDTNSKNTLLVPYYHVGTVTASLNSGAGAASTTVIDQNSNVTVFPNIVTLGGNLTHYIARIAGGSGTSGSGAALEFVFGGSANNFIGGYSAIQGGSYNNSLTLVGSGGILMPSDTLGVKTGSSVPNGNLAAFGPTTGSTHIGVYGGNTNSGDGSAYYIYNGTGSTPIGAIGNYSQILGGAYVRELTIWDAGQGITMPSDGLSVGSQTNPGAGVINANTGYQTAGVSGVSCAANTVSLTTLVISGGIATHC